jgi:hypothetical protein
MTYYVESRWGGSEDEPSEERMRELLAELDENDPEHPDTWLTHDSGWSLAVFETGLVVWEHLELPDPPRHLINVTREKALDLWLQLARGHLVEIEREPWKDGYGPPLSEEEIGERAREVAKLVMESDRKFYEILGPERSEKPCSTEGCPRGAIVNSIFCRVHHFESVLHKPSPFSD